MDLNTTEMVFNAAFNLTNNGTLDDHQFYGYDHEWQRILARVRFYTVNFTICLVMGVVGCLTKPHIILYHIRRPVGISIGVASQFIIMPLCAFSIAHAMKLPALESISLLVLSSTPGGAISNMFAYWARGDINLSIAMTSASTCLALGMMPLNLYLYSRSWTSDSIRLPMKNVGMSLVFIVIPTTCGCLLAYKFPKLAAKMEKHGNRAGVILIFLTVVVMAIILDYRYIFASWKVWVAAWLLPSLSTGLGYAAAYLFRQSHQRCRTIAFETGSQNIPLTMAVLLLTFSGKDQSRTMPIPFIYSMTIFTVLTTCTLVARYFVKDTDMPIDVTIDVEQVQNKPEKEKKREAGSNKSEVRERYTLKEVTAVGINSNRRDEKDVEKTACTA